MSRMDCCLANKVYALKKQCPAIEEFGRRIREVEKELNKGCGHNKCACDCYGKPTGNCHVKNRQKP